MLGIGKYLTVGLGLLLIATFSTYHFAIVPHLEAAAETAKAEVATANAQTTNANSTITNLQGQIQDQNQAAEICKANASQASASASLAAANVKPMALPAGKDLTAFKAWLGALYAEPPQ